jgi:hypothetical protein
MAVAFKKPFTRETQDLRDWIDMTNKDHEEIPCARCEAGYVLVFLKSSTGDQRERYRHAVQQAMGNCEHHPPSIALRGFGFLG